MNITPILETILILLIGINLLSLIGFVRLYRIEITKIHSLKREEEGIKQERRELREVIKFNRKIMAKNWTKKVLEFQTKESPDITLKYEIPGINENYTGKNYYKIK